VTNQTFYISGVTVGPPLPAFVALEDYNAPALMQFRNASGGSTATIVANQLQVTGPTGTHQYQQFVSSANPDRNGAAMTALLNATALKISLQAIGGQPQDFQVALAYNTDVPGYGYSGANNGVGIAAAQTGTVTMTVPCGPTTTLGQILAKYRAGQGTYVMFWLDNAGFPTLNNSVQFYVNNVSVAPTTPPPSATAPSLALSHDASGTAWRLDWPAAPFSPLYHLYAAPSLTGPWVPATQSSHTNTPISTSLVPLGSPSGPVGYFRLMKY